MGKRKKSLKETRYAKITVKAETKEEIKEQFKLLTKFCDTKVKWIRPKVGGLGEMVIR